LGTEDDEGVAIVRKIKFHLLFSRVTLVASPTRPPQGSGLAYRVRRLKMEVAKEELQTALKSIRGRRVERAELDALVQTTLDETKTRVDGAPIPNATWEYLLRSEILSLAVRLSLISFLMYELSVG